MDSPIASGTALTNATPNAFPLIFSATVPLIIIYINFSLQRLNCSCSKCHISNIQTILHTLFILIVTLDSSGRGQLKCDGTRTETRFSLSAKRTSPFKSAVRRQFSRLLAAEVCASAVVMQDTPCSEVVWRVLATHPIRQFPLHFPSRASQCAITF